MSQLIDLETVKEFMKETLDKVDEKYLVQLADDLEIKSQMFSHSLSLERIESIDEKEMLHLLKLIFPIKRKAQKLLDEVGIEKLRLLIKDLLYAEVPVQKRFQRFCTQLKFETRPLRADLAGELLHFTFPDTYWMWSSWMWNPKQKTGAIPLVVTDGFDLTGKNVGDIYMKVGRAHAFVHSMSETGGYHFISKKLFGTDVFLSCVYVIYAYTILKMRMTQEFNKVMPGVIEFSRRILGVYMISEKQFSRQNT